MPTFPESKTDILILAARVATGITNNPVDYPNPPFDPGPVSTALGQAMSLMSDRQAKEAELKAILEQENAKVGEVRVLLRQLLDQAETTHGNDAAKLQEIDWDVPADPKHLVPGEVRNLEAIHQGAGTVEIDWKAPARTAATGKPTVYKITRETRTIDKHTPIEEFGTWTSVSFKPKTLLMDQPRGVEISYRVTASNTNGDGPPVQAERVVL